MTQLPASNVPVCYRHTSRETFLRCSRCDRPICPSCMNEAPIGHQCPECVSQGRRTQRRPLTAFGGSHLGQRGYVTKTLIALNVLVMLLALATADRAGHALAGGGLGGLLGSETPLHQWGALIARAPYVGGGPLHGVAVGEYYRLLTSMFLHYGFLHLLMNMWALWVLGRPLEGVLGPWRFAALYVAAGLGGSVAVYLFSNPHAATAGASGAIFGLFSALILVLRKLGRSVASVIPILVLNLVITFGVPGISIGGHLGGLVTGAVVGAGLTYAPKEGRTPVQVAVIGATLVILVALTLVRTASLSA